MLLNKSVPSRGKNSLPSFPIETNRWKHNKCHNHSLISTLCSIPCNVHIYSPQVWTSQRLSCLVEYTAAAYTHRILTTALARLLQFQLCFILSMYTDIPTPGKPPPFHLFYNIQSSFRSSHTSALSACNLEILIITQLLYTSKSFHINNYNNFPYLCTNFMMLSDFASMPPFNVVWVAME